MADAMNATIKTLLKKFDQAANDYNAAEILNITEKLLEQIRDNIATHPEAFLIELDAAIKVFNRSQVEALCQKLVTHLRARAKPYPIASAKQILGALRRKRYFDCIVQVADVFIQTGQNAPNIRRQYAQALLDLGHISAALDVLENLQVDCEDTNDQGELAETIGLLGRARKQIYINASLEQKAGSTVRKSVVHAADTYASVYKNSKEHIWHGINTVALLQRAKRDKIKLAKDSPNPDTIAREIIKLIKAKKEPDLWDMATAGEASIALKDYAGALKWLVKYTREDNGADAFEYASTLRQLEEVWALDENDSDQAKILHLLRAALLQQEGGQLELSSPVHNLAAVDTIADDQLFEQILGKDRYKTFQWYRMGLDRASGVAQIFDHSGNGLGTGFLLRGSDIHPTWSDEWIVVTNAHVISDDPAEQHASPPSLASDEVNIRFEAKETDQTFTVDDILFSSPRRELDCTIVSLQSKVEHDNPYPIAKRLPIRDKNQRVYVIGHPKGGRLSYSINDNLLLDHQTPLVHYRAPTEGGSSGSPVFDANWNLIALHHAGGTRMKKLNGQDGFYPANEGLSFQSIRDAVAHKLD